MQPALTFLCNSNRSSLTNHAQHRFIGCRKSKCPPPPSCSKKKPKCESRVFCDVDPHCSPPKFVSMWEPPKNLPKPYPFEFKINQLCCEPNCTKPLPRFDQMFYHPSCKDRKFQRTWVECPEFMIRKKKICCYDKLHAIQPPRRSPKREPGCVPSTACTYKDPNELRCPRVLPMPCQRKGRRPCRCFKTREPICCRRLCAPMPSWSECKQPEPGIHFPRAPECFCLGRVSMCEAIRALKILQRYGEPKTCPKPNKCKKT